MGPVRAVGFDFNGTLSNDEPILFSIYRELFAEHERPLTEEDYYGTLAGRSEEAIIGSWLGVEGDQLEALVAERVNRFLALAADGSSVHEHVRAAVRYAAERVPIGLVSSAFRREIEPVLAAAGIAPLFRALVTAEDVSAGKPAPDCYLELLRRLDGRLRADEVVAFEDTEAGVAAAKAAGLRCIAVLGTLPHARLAAADEIVDEIDVPLMRRLLA